MSRRQMLSEQMSAGQCVYEQVSPGQLSPVKICSKELLWKLGQNYMKNIFDITNINFQWK